MNGNKFATSHILKKLVEVVKGRILAGWAQKSPEPWCGSKNGHQTNMRSKEIGLRPQKVIVNIIERTYKSIEIMTKMAKHTIWIC
jgi:hypothetical protein